MTFAVILRFTDADIQKKLAITSHKDTSDHIEQDFSMEIDIAVVVWFLRLMNIITAIAMITIRKKIPLPIG